jgi:soluble lytic murein transglycosylase-like protein
MFAAIIWRCLAYNFLSAISIRDGIGMKKTYLLIGLLCWGTPLAAALAGDLYGFTDEQGGIHLTNYPYDARYKRIADTSQTESAPRKEVQEVRKNLPVHAYSPLIKDAASLYHIDEALLHAIIKTESDYNPNAVSRKGAIGLMQLMPETAKRYSVINAKDPTENVRGGARYLKDLLKKFNNDLSLTLAAYNAGEMKVLRHGNTVPPYRETLNYVPQVLRYYQSYSGCNRYPC